MRFLCRARVFNWMSLPPLAARARPGIWAPCSLSWRVEISSSFSEKVSIFFASPRRSPWRRLGQPTVLSNHSYCNGHRHCDDAKHGIGNCSLKPPRRERYCLRTDLAKTISEIKPISKSPLLHGITNMQLELRKVQTSATRFTLCGSADLS